MLPSSDKARSTRQGTKQDAPGNKKRIHEEVAYKEEDTQDDEEEDDEGNSSSSPDYETEWDDEGGPTRGSKNKTKKSPREDKKMSPAMRKREGDASVKAITADIVDGGIAMTWSQVRAAFPGASKSTATRAGTDAKVALQQAQARREALANDTVHKIQKVLAKDEVLGMVEWLKTHLLVNEPEPQMVNTFASNSGSDVLESALENRTLATDNRGTRAWDLADQFEKRSAGRSQPSVNTLMCVLYSPTSVKALLHAMKSSKTTEFPHLLVLHVGKVFVLLVTGHAEGTSRFPLQWFMKTGDHTSAFLWVNLKTNWWERYNPTEEKKRKVEAFHHVSEQSLCGLTLLHLLFQKAESLAATTVGKENRAAVYHVHVQPSAAASVPSWSDQVEKFLRSSHVASDKTGAAVPDVEVTATPGESSYLCIVVFDLVRSDSFGSVAAY